MRRLPPRLALAALGLALALPAPAARAAPPAVPAPPLTLPGDAGAARTQAWLVGARPGSVSARLAARYGAEALAPASGLGAYAVPRARARAFAAALRRADRLVWAEPDRLARRTQAPVPAPDPLSPAASWRDAVVPAGLAPPPVTPDSPLLALVDSQADLAHPEFAGGGVTTANSFPALGSHGTATAAVAAAPANGVGILGIWPGMRAVNVGLPEAGGISCRDSVRQIERALQLGAVVLNMSYGSRDLCYAEYLVLQFAVARGVVPVAAAGNEFAEGNPLEFPASLPHVLTVAAVDAGLGRALFSNASPAVDVSAPGVQILTAVRPGDLGDAEGDGYAALDGTSFAAPMVAAAATWVRAVRPELSADQVSQVVRLSARDLGARRWDPTTGFGLLDVGAALTRDPPPADPSEPNDDIPFIDGRAFGRPDRPVFSGRRTRTLLALLDRFEDPADLYRVIVPGGARVGVTVRPRFGDVDLAGYTRAARELGETRGRGPVSRRRGEATERITLVNRSRRAATFYAAAYIDRRARGLDAAYTLTVRRLSDTG